MKQTKFVILAAGLLGIIACFLPFVSEGPISLSIWDFRKMPEANSGLINGPKQVYLAFALFGIPALLAATALASKLQRALAGVAAAGFGLTFALELVRKGMTGEAGMSTAIGGKLLFLSALVGLVASIVAVAKPEE
jgi:hypothetical protein